MKQDQRNNAELKKAQQEFIAGMLDELRLVERAKASESIYTSLSVPPEIRVADVERPGCDIARVSPKINFWRLSEGVLQVDEVNLHCSINESGLRSLSRSCKRARKETDPRPWIGYDYKSIHASVVKFIEAAAKVRAQHKRQRTSEEVARKTLMAAIQSAGFTVVDARYEILILLDSSSGHRLRLAQDGGFVIRGMLTPENAARVLPAITALAAGLKEV
jgi:hypothetical protein